MAVHFSLAFKRIICKQPKVVLCLLNIIFSRDNHKLWFYRFIYVFLSDNKQMTAIQSWNREPAQIWIGPVRHDVYVNFWRWRIIVVPSSATWWRQITTYMLRVSLATVAVPVHAVAELITHEVSPNEEKILQIDETPFVMGNETVMLNPVSEKSHAAATQNSFVVLKEVSVSSRRQFQEKRDYSHKQNHLFFKTHEALDHSKNNDIKKAKITVFCKAQDR